MVNTDHNTLEDTSMAMWLDWDWTSVRRGW